MSAPTISQSYKDQFNDDVRMYFQQQGSLLKRKVTNDCLAAQNGYFEYIKPVEASQRTERAAEVNITPVEHERRKCSMTVWDANDYVDKFEQKIVAPGMAQRYAANFAMALGRQQDRNIINGAIGTAYSGRNGTTPVAFDTTNQQIAVNYQDGGGGSNSNITLAKLRQVLGKLTGSNALLPSDSPALITIAYTSSQLVSLLAIAENLKVTGITTEALATGNPSVVFYGMNFVRLDTSILPITSSSIRTLVAFTSDSIQYAEGQDINAAIDWIPNRKSWLVATDFQGDAARVRDKGVVTVLCDETKV